MVMMSLMVVDMLFLRGLYWVWLVVFVMVMGVLMVGPFYSVVERGDLAGYVVLLVVV